MYDKQNVGRPDKGFEEKNYYINGCLCVFGTCLCTGLKYEAVEKLLALTSCNYECDKLSVDCYHNLLDGTLCYKQRTCKHDETVGELSERYRDKRLIIRINGHLTCSLYGTIVDIWDCTEKTADVFWIVE